MATTTDRGEESDELARYVPAIIAGVVLVIAVPVGILRGAPAVVLGLAFAMLSSAVLLFWEALRTALDTTAPGDEVDLDEAGVPTDLEARKKAAMRALKDIEFERSIGRLSEEDYKDLERRYRDEARAAMKAIDEGLGPWLTRADEMLKKAAGGATFREPAPADLTPQPPLPEGRGGAGEETTTATEKPDASPPTSPSPARERGPGGEVRCAKCETVNDSDAVFCKKCGTRVAPEEHADAS